ncbi:MAG: carboxymuconolactone decarboxylase family protein [Luteolibacter sp.]|uniref:carboxymuconolactone decarboxylase family protein n=1 Tax=Luteolibacter sp. TaxID=1962973 RepID=UPI00326407E6
MNTPTNTDPQKPRLEYWKAAPEVIKAMLAMETAVRTSGLAPILQELIKLRVSQINGCAYCADMHFKDAKKIGETDDRLNLLAFWQEVDLFTPQEKAALHWVEKLTRLPGGHVSDEDFAIISAHFSEADIAKITLAIVTINSWNRFGIGFRLPVGFKA